MLLFQPAYYGRGFNGVLCRAKRLDRFEEFFECNGKELAFEQPISDSSHDEHLLFRGRIIYHDRHISSFFAIKQQEKNSKSE
jgi:hypothetical protein